MLGLCVCMCVRMSVCMPSASHYGSDSVGHRIGGGVKPTATQLSMPAIAGCIEAVSPSSSLSAPLTSPHSPGLPGSTVTMSAGRSGQAGSVPAQAAQHSTAQHSTAQHGPADQQQVPLGSSAWLGTDIFDGP